MRTRTTTFFLLLSVIILLGVYFAPYTGPAFRNPAAATCLIASAMPARLPVPVSDVKPAQLRDSWGAPRPGGRPHQGIDIFAPRGRAIRSTTCGIVMTVGHTALGGRIVRVLGPGGHWHYYAHLERFAPLRVGQVIEAGTVIGYVGDSGNAKGTPPHLHYGIYRLWGGALNPYPLLTSRPTG